MPWPSWVPWLGKKSESDEMTAKAGVEHAAEPQPMQAALPPIIEDPAAPALGLPTPAVSGADTATAGSSGARFGFDGRDLRIFFYGAGFGFLGGLIALVGVSIAAISKIAATAEEHGRHIERVERDFETCVEREHAAAEAAIAETERIRAQLRRYEDVIAAYRGDDAHMKALSAAALQELSRKLLSSMQVVATAQKREARRRELAAEAAEAAAAGNGHQAAGVAHLAPAPTFACGVCLQPREGPRRVLQPCGHVVCVRCSEQDLGGGRGRCHACRKRVTGMSPIFD